MSSTGPLRRRSSVSLSPSRWSSYAIAGATGTVAISFSQHVEAAIHVTTVGQTFDAGASSTVFQNFTVSGVAHFSMTHYRSESRFGAAYFKGLNLSFRGFSNPTNGAKYVSKLNAGSNLTVGGFKTGLGTLAFAAGFAGSQWKAAGTGFIGFRFDLGGGFQYGWAQVTMLEGTPGNSFRLVNFAWADLGTSIVAGQVPEPGSLALLAVGGAGLLIWRQKRRGSRETQSAG